MANDKTVTCLMDNRLPIPEIIIYDQGVGQPRVFKKSLTMDFYVEVDHNFVLEIDKVTEA